MKMSATLLASLLGCAMVLPGAAWAQSASPGATASTAPGEKGGASADNAAAISAATESVTRWLALADAGNWSASWDQMAPAAQAKGTQAVFSGAMAAAREPLGAVKSRTLRSAVLTHTMPGAVDGDYVVVQYDTAFANKARAVETLIPMRSPDGSWKVSGYGIR